MTDHAIRFENVSKTYASGHALRNISATAPGGRTTVLCGPSGSGKSTLIRLVNRLDTLSGGRILVGDQDIHDRRLDLNRFRSGIGFIAQSFNLFPHLTVLENTTIALRRVRKLGRADADERAHAQLARLGLAAVVRRYPAQLSGGQQQRVAIARALAMEPAILLFDEPTSALDPELVREVHLAIQSLSADGLTILCVTHELQFARHIADRVWFLEDGALVQDRASESFFRDNDNPRVRRFLASLAH